MTTTTTINQITTWLNSHTVAELRDAAKHDFRVSLGGCAKKSQIVARLAAHICGGHGLLNAAQAATNLHHNNNYIKAALA